MAKTAIGIGLALAGLTALVALGVFQGDAKQGYVAPGVLAADFNLACQVLLVAGLTFGAWLARRGSIEAHRVNQTVWVLVNSALVLTVMLPALENAKVGSLSELAEASTALAWLHATLGAFTVASGLWLVLQMNDILPARLHVRRWKTLMRLTLAGYWTTALAGLVTYYFWHK